MTVIVAKNVIEQLEALVAAGHPVQAMERGCHGHPGEARREKDRPAGGRPGASQSRGRSLSQRELHGKEVLDLLGRVPLALRLHDVDHPDTGVVDAGRAATPLGSLVMWA